jgi:hypothetical protein
MWTGCPSESTFKTSTNGSQQRKCKKLREITLLQVNKTFKITMWKAKVSQLERGGEPWKRKIM